MTKRKQIFKFVFLFTLIVSVIIGSLAATEYVMLSSDAQVLIAEFGYIGILLVSFIAGLNVLIPVPAATFVPIFSAAGISLPVIILLLVIGTMAANLLAYFAGYYGGKIAHSKYPTIQKKLLVYYLEKREWLPYFVFLFAAFVPLPDEVYLIPLGIIGVKLKQFIIPLVLGTIVYQSLTALGVQNIFSLVLANS